MRKTLWALALLLFSALPLQAATICLTGAAPAGGCGSTVATIALAIAAAADGDTIYLRAGTTYSGHWTLTDKNMATGIVITTDAAVASLPPAGTRINPSYAAFLPILHSDTNTDSVFFAPSGSDHYTLRALWFTNNPRGESDVISLGSNACDNPGYCQEFESDEPSFMTVDRVLMTNSAIIGQKRGISLGGKNLTVKNSYLTGFAGFGQDSQCIAGANGRGPVLIDNNYCDAAGEDFMFGGDDPKERTVMTITGAATTSSAVVTVSAGGVSGVAHNLSELAIGQEIAILTLTNTQRRYTHLLSKSGSGTTGTITFEPIPEVPDVPGDIRGGAVFSGVTITRNQFAKQLGWQSPILSAPTSAVSSWNVSAGTLAAGTYTYSVVAVNKTGYAGNTMYSSPVATTVTLTATGQAVIAWQASPSATFYQVYASHTAGTAVTMYFEVASTLLTYTDTGSAGTVATKVPTASKWSLKNLGELKSAKNVLISGNVFEYQWIGSDSFPAIAFKSTNQGGSCEFCVVRDVVVENNIIRHVAGAFAITGQESEDPVTGTRLGKNFPPPATNITIRNNLIYDSNSTWLLKNDGTFESSKPAFNIQNHVVNLKIDHNTVIHTMRAFADLSCANTAKPLECQEDALQITNNLGFANTYGIKGDTVGSGTSALTLFASSPYTVTANVIAGISTSQYPAGNFGPTATALQAEFTNYSATGADTALGPADFHLLSTSTYATAATDGTPIGANIDAILTATSGVTTGSVAQTVVGPTITTVSLPAGTNGTAYSFTLTGSGTGALSWAVISGSLPSGIALSAGGVFSGTPVSTGPATFTVRVTDAATSMTASQALTLTINQTFVSVSIATGATLTAGVEGTPYTTTLVQSDGLAPFTWALASGSLPAGLAVDATTGILSGIPTTIAGNSFSLSVTDARGTSDTKAFTLAVGNEVMPTDRARATSTIFQAATYLRPVQPTSVDLVRKGDIWVDTSTNPPTVRVCSSVTPITFTKVSADPSSHNLLSSTHADTASETPTTGDLMVYGQDAKWHRLPIGSSGTVVGTADGVTVGYVPQAQSTNTVINNTTSRPVLLTYSTAINGNVSWNASIGAGPTEFAGVSRGRLAFNFSSFKECMLEARPVTVGDAGTIMYVQYSTDGAVTWRALDGGTGPSVPIDTSIAALNTGSFAQIETAAKNGLVLTRIVAAGGSSTITPTFGTIAMLCQ